LSSPATILTLRKWPNRSQNGQQNTFKALIFGQNLLDDHIIDIPFGPDGEPAYDRFLEAGFRKLEFENIPGHPSHKFPYLVTIVYPVDPSSFNTTPMTNRRIVDRPDLPDLVGTVIARIQQRKSESEDWADCMDVMHIGLIVLIIRAALAMGMMTQ